MNHKTRCLAVAFVIFSFSVTIGSAQLYVRSNYHPRDDKNLGKIERDIKLMKAAGLNVVRMGHLTCDSYEPAESKFDFEWFDQAMDLINDAGIKVILDIAIRPAPLWLHHKFPLIDILDKNDDVQFPNQRYMEDVGDPNYQKYALRFTGEMTKHYANYPALLAFGIDNESGDGQFIILKLFVDYLLTNLKTNI